MTFACMKKFACCAIVAVAVATAIATATAIVIFIIIIKYMFPIFSRAHRTVHRVVYKHHKFYREVHGGGARPFFLPYGAVLDILLVDSAVAFGERHIFDALVRHGSSGYRVFSSVYFHAGNTSPTNSTRRTFMRLI